MCVYLCCLIQEVPVRDEPVWNWMDLGVYSCIVWVVLSVVLCDCGTCGVCFITV